MLTAIWLFENHSAFLAKEHYFSAMLNEDFACTDSSLCCFPDKASEESVQLRSPDPAFLKAELMRCRFYLLLYESMMLALTPNERWLVQQRFDNGLAFSEIIELPDAPNIARSNSSLSRHMNHIICKSDQLLKTLGIQSDVSS